MWLFSKKSDPGRVNLYRDLADPATLLQAEARAVNEDRGVGYVDD